MGVGDPCRPKMDTLDFALISHSFSTFTGQSYISIIVELILASFQGAYSADMCPEGPEPMEMSRLYPGLPKMEMKWLNHLRPNMKSIPLPLQNITVQYIRTSTSAC